MSFAPTLQKIEKVGKYILVIVVIGWLMYYNLDQINESNEQMSKKNLGNELYENGDSNNHWFVNLMTKIVGENFSWFAIKEMSTYLIMGFVGLIGIRILSHYNNLHELKLLKEQEEFFKKQNKMKGKSKFANKKND